MITTRKRVQAALCLVSVAAALGCGGRSSADWQVTIEPTIVAAGPESSEPQLTTSDRGVIVSWLERTGTTAHLKFAERTTSGWSAPVDVASGSDWFLSYADTPSVMRLSDGTLVAQWLRLTDEFLEAYDLLISYSNDDGKTWSPPFSPHDDGTKTQHGFASMFEQPGRQVGLVWLDGRAGELDTTSAEGGAMSLRYGAFDANWRQIADTAIDLKVCECCPTTAVVTADGIVTAFRDRSDSEIRDISVSRLENGAWSAPSTVHDDNWMIEACPVNGPMLAARGRAVAAAWFTVAGNQGQAYAAFSQDGGRTWGSPIRLDDGGSLGRVDIELLDDGSAAATWVEFANRRAEFRLRRVEPSGERSMARSVAGVSGGRTSGYPRVARRDDELIFAWTETAPGAEDGAGSMQLRTARAKLP